MNILDPQGPIAAADKQILIDSIAIMLAIVLPTIAAIFAFAFYFRKSNTRAFYWPDWEYSGRLELVVWSIPSLTIILLGGVAWIGAHQLDPARLVPGTGQGVTIQVVSLDWKWLFIYPDESVASVNELVVPAGVPVHFSLTSASVMNMFFVPQLGSMIATMNGMVTQLHLAADKPGEFYGQSAQYSGGGFSDMNFMVRAVPQDAFAQWVATARQSGPALDRTSYLALCEQSKDVSPFTYRSVDASLFDAIVSQQLPPCPGPNVEGVGAAVRPRTER
jgi:cytochrome o ubiquinol oxidase subunit 2